ncbi:MAG: hypothetical protein DWQ36_01980 [Acidobacteria bacterium]|nr:MAG: hypothetical protein DWQ30_16825 [Acidobacteriota bacterium]REK11537.1 MAG: hypothetical protein DWQ36_01980 [Acidobacteriota bacterium]
MSLRRILAVGRLELSQTLRRPMFWILLLLLTLMSWGLSAGNVTIASGDTAVGGDKAWINSESQMTMFVIVLTFLITAFFASVAAGMAVLRDDEVGASEILHTTPLRPAEYVAGKFAGVTVTFLFALTWQLLTLVVFFQLMPIENAAEVRGDFRLGAYLRPMLFFALPNVLFALGTAFAVGERARRPILVFFLPVALLLVCGFFLWDWSPSWLDPRINDLLMVVDPSGLRWLDEAWLSIDRGVEVYNTEPVAYDWRILVNRAWILLVGLGAVAASVPHVARTLSGEARPGGLSRLLRRRRRDEAAPASAAATGRAAIDDPRLAELAMRRGRASRAAGLGAVVRAEVRELLHQPGLYLFVPLILLQTVGNATFAIGAFDTPILLTSGYLAVNSVSIVTTLVCLLLLFYTVESLQRERSTGFGELLYSSPVATWTLLVGKALANSLVGAAILLGAFVASVIVLLVQGSAPVETWPFFVTWILLVAPTFVLWTAFVTWLYALVRERYTAYALAIGALVATFYFQFRGELTWTFNWPLWGTLQWSDMGTYELNRQQLVLNRVTVLGAALFFAGFAVRLFSRRDFDGLRSIQRLHPRLLVRTTLRLAPLALLPLITGGVLAYQVRSGFQGEPAEKLAKDYWRKNFATFADDRDAPVPVVRHVEVRVELEPAERRFAVEGSYELVNEHDVAIDAVAMTANRAWEEIAWQIDGVEATSEDREGLHLLRPARALEPGEGLRLGFRLRGTHPAGATKAGGGVPTFVLPSGVVLHTFEPSFLPLPGFQGGIGVDEDNAFEPREYPDDFWEEELDTAFGQIRPFTTRVQITTPADYTANSVGTLTSSREHTGEDGRALRTVVWESDHPVKLLNVVAGRYDVLRAGGTALFYHPGHTYNIDEMSSALQAAREHFSEWFYEFPWNELKVSEFPALAGYAQGFPTNITFSEGIGFLTESDEGSNAAFMVTAHEAAHQWWGNLITPGEGPGGNILSEGMAHYSTLLLHEEEHGLRGRIEFARRIEDSYAEDRQVDSERPLVKIDGSRAGDTTVTYDKGGWVMWMLHQLMGREATLAGLQELFRIYVPSTDDHPVLQDLLATLRPYAPDPQAFDEFTEQWYFDVVVPEYEIRDASKQRSGDGWLTRWTVRNKGTGRMPVEIAASRGERFPDDEARGAQSTGETYRDTRVSVVLGAGEEQALELRTDFEPQQIVVDPDALVLQLERSRALARL